MLDKARERAAELHQKGALFPWRTINGEEASAYYAAGTAQYHLNADIMYALKKYVDVTGDTELLYDEGVEMLVETARMWIDLGFFSEREGGSFCIHAVTGPDEYTTVVDNNLFTNLMARLNLHYASSSVAELRAKDPTAIRGPGPPDRPRRVGGRRMVASCGRHVPAVRRADRYPPAGLALPGSSGLGFREHRGRTTTRCCCTTTRSRSTGTR